jgi:hypothetical protein
VRVPDGLKPVSAWVQSGSYSTEQVFGTRYDGTTQWHTYKVPVTPGVHQLDLSIFDRGDSEYDSTAVVDDLRLIRRRPAGCTAPGRDQFSTAEDLDAPAVTIGASGDRLSGTASTGPDDVRSVTVEVEGRSWTTSVRGKTLRAAGRAIRRAHCRIGRIARKRARKGRRGRVLTQSPRAGARRARGTRVKLTLRR